MENKNANLNFATNCSFVRNKYQRQWAKGQLNLENAMVVEGSSSQCGVIAYAELNKAVGQALQVHE